MSSFVTHPVVAAALIDDHRRAHERTAENDRLARSSQRRRLPLRRRTHQ